MTFESGTTSASIQAILDACVYGLLERGIKILDDNATFTLHCFRRGGCQHRFFKSKRGWPLPAIKAWGGWSKSERPDVLINYVMNEYELIENDFSDFCNPLKRDRNVSSLDQEIQPIDLETKYNALQALLIQRFNHLESMLRLQTVEHPIETAPIQGVVRAISSNPQASVTCAVKIPDFKSFSSLIEQYTVGGIGLKPLKDWTTDEITARNVVGMSKAAQNSRKSKYYKRKQIALSILERTTEESIDDKLIAWVTEMEQKLRSAGDTRKLGLNSALGLLGVAES